LVFHNLSQFQQVRVAGGDLVQTNGSTFNTSGNSIGAVGGFNSFVSIDGARSDYNPNVLKQANINSGAFILRNGLSQDALANTARNQFVFMDGNWTYDLGTGTATQVVGSDTFTFAFSGTGQTMLDKMFNQRAFTGDLTIKGDIAANLEVNVGSVAGTLDLVGNNFGRIEANGLQAKIGTLKIEGNQNGEIYVRGIDRTAIANDAFQNTIGSVIVTGNMGSDSLTGAYIIAEGIGDVTIGGNLSGLISTDVYLGGGFGGVALSGTNYTDYTGAIGNVSITGNVANGSVQGMTGIGNINVGGNVTGAGAATKTVAGVFSTSAAQNNVAVGQSAANLSVGKIGTLTVVGDVDLDSPSIYLINVNEEGNFGNVSIQGNGKLGRLDGNDFLNVGAVGVRIGFGNASNTTGTITIADAQSTSGRGTDINFGGVQIGYGGTKAVGTVGAITVNGGGEDTDFVLSGSVGSTTLPYLGILAVNQPNASGDAVTVTSFSVNGFEDILINANIQGRSIGAINLTPIAGVGSGDSNDGTNTKVGTSVTLNAGIFADDGVPNQGETIGDLAINLGTTNSAIVLGAGFMLGTADVLKGTGSQIGNVALTANTITGTAGSWIFAEKIGNTSLNAGGTINWATAYNGIQIGNITASTAGSITVSGAIGTSGDPGNVFPLGFPIALPADRTEMVGNISLTATSNSSVTLSSTVNSDVIGTTTLTGKDGTLTFSASYLTAANAQSTATGSYGAISLTSSTKGNIAFGGTLAGATGGDVTLSTLSSGTIGVTTTYTSGAAGKLNATAADGTITYNADLDGGSLGAVTLTSTTKGTINYGAASHFAGSSLGDVTISTKSTGAVTYTGAFGTTTDSLIGGTDGSNLAIGLVSISAEAGNVTINPLYDDKVTSAGALSATTTTGDITYSAATVGNGVATVGGAITGGKESGSIGAVTLTTTGTDGDIFITAQLEATSFGGLNLQAQAVDTTSPATSSTISFTNADIWAASVGAITAQTAEGGITVDNASTFRGFTNSSGTSTSVGAITLTVAAKGALTFNGLVEATTNKSAADNSGSMSIGDFTLNGNNTGGIAFNGQLQVGKADNMSLAGLFDGVFDAGTIGKITFNGNTTLGALSQFGTETTQTSLQALQNGLQQNDQFALLASSIAGFQVNGSLTSVAGTGADGLIRAGSLATFDVTGAVTLVGDAANGAAGLVFVPQLGVVTLGDAGNATTLTAGNAATPVFVAHDIAGIGFFSDTTTLNGGTIFLALDATSDLDTIGNIAIAGSVVGNAASNFAGTPRAEIEASSIGNILAAANVNASSPLSSLFVDFDVRASNIRGNAATDVDAVTAGNQAGTHAITNETIAQNGSNLSNFKIGNISIAGIPTNGLDATYLFSGSNSFVATGQIGNIDIVGGKFGTVQTKMFNPASPGTAWFTVGDSDSLAGAANSGTDFNGDGIISNVLNPGVTETTSDFTGTTAKVTIGNINVIVDNTATAAPPLQDFDAVGGATGTATDGFVVLAGVQLNGAGTLANSAVPGTRGSRIEADLDGYIASVLIQNGDIADIATKNAETGGTAGFGSVIGVAGDGTAADDIGDIVNIISSPVVPLEDGETVIIGDTDAVDDTTWDVNEVLVYVV
jgi:hypothetical protein